jgi:excisionase family DNA binding protein
MSLIRGEKDFISPKEAAEALGKSESFIYSQIKKGALPARKWGGSVVILKADFDNYVGSTGPEKLKK